MFCCRDHHWRCLLIFNRFSWFHKAPVALEISVKVSSQSLISVKVSVWKSKFPHDEACCLLTTLFTGLLVYENMDILNSINSPMGYWKKGITLIHITHYFSDKSVVNLGRRFSLNRAPFRTELKTGLSMSLVWQRTLFGWFWCTFL